MSLDSPSPFSEHSKHWTFVAEGGIRQARVSGFLWVGAGGHRLAAAGWRDGARLRLEVLAQQTSPGITIPVHHSYDAVLHQVPPGTYTLQVVHRSMRRIELAFDQEIEVE